MKRGREEEEFTENEIKKFHFACENGDVKEVQYFIDRGVDVNAKDDYKSSALHFAAQNGRDDIAKVLIENGAFVDIRTNLQNETPLHMACLDVAKVLLLNGADMNAVEIGRPSSKESH